jgi:hypothetical protein
MNRDVAVAQASPWPLLSPAAVGHLAHDLRGSIHVIRGHAELLRDEAADEQARESARYIVDTSVRLAGMCEDVIEFLGLPVIACGKPVVLAFDDIACAVASLASGRGIQLRTVGLVDSCRPVLVDPSVRRIVAHVLEHAVRVASGDITIAATFRTARESCVIEVRPVPVATAENDGVIALAAQLLEARGGGLAVSGRGMELHVPLIGRSS